MSEEIKLWEIVTTTDWLFLAPTSRIQFLPGQDGFMRLELDLACHALSRHEALRQLIDHTEKALAIMRAVAEVGDA